MPERQKIGVLGGTFDPIHYGHLRIAETLREVYGLDKVLLIPTGLPPHRASPNVTGTDRLHMTQLAVGGMSHLVADAREVLRDGWCYTFDTLTELQQECPETDIVWLAGTDAFAGLTYWHRWTELLDLAHLAIACRPGLAMDHWYESLPVKLRQQYDLRLAVQNTMPYQLLTGKISLLPTINLDISATVLREKVRLGQSLRFLTPDSVIDYIDEHGLYQ